MLNECFTEPQFFAYQIRFFSSEISTQKKENMRMSAEKDQTAAGKWKVKRNQGHFLKHRTEN